MEPSPRGTGKPPTTNGPRTSSSQRFRQRWRSFFSFSTRTNTSAAIQRQEVQPQQALNSQFHGARGVVVNNSQFTAALGHHFTINMPVNHPETAGEPSARRGLPIPTAQDEPTSGELAITTTNSRSSGDGDRLTPGTPLTILSSPTPRTSNEVYETLLSPKNRGFALWIPEPSKNLHLSYRKKGIQIGDVGIIKPSGCFLFMFNICLPRDDPINSESSLPEDFAPISPPIDPFDIHRFAIFKSGSYLASSAIEKSQDDSTSPGLSFRTSASEGAILTMPEGAISEDLENVPRFREFAAANVHKWYKYINGTRGREAKNGDVRLVVGCDKATSWGMAALPHTNQHCQLKFKPLDGQATDSPTRYTWEHSGTAEAKVGPDQEEIDELRREDEDPPTQVKYLNQCLFVRTLNIKLEDEEWDKLNREIGVGCTPDSTIGRGTGTSFLSPRNGGHPSDNTQSTSSISGLSGIQRTASDSSASRFTSRAKGLIFSSPPTATLCHPSRILNDALLKKFPNAKMVITRDEDWYPCIQEDMTMSPDPEHIFASLSTTNDIREENGVVYLEPNVSREMKYFAHLEQLSIELKKKSSNMEQYLCGTDPGRSVRWNEMVFLLEFCHAALAPSASDADNNVPSRKSPPDANRLREIETLLGSLLIDELSLDKPDAFESIYTLRSLTPRAESSDFNDKVGALRKLFSILGRESTVTEYPNPSIKPEDGQSSTSEIGSRRSTSLLTLSSDSYLLYLALGEPADLKQTIEYIRQWMLPEWTSLDSSCIPPAEEDTIHASAPGFTTRPMNHLTSYMPDRRITPSQQQIESQSHGPDNGDQSRIEEENGRRTRWYPLIRGPRSNPGQTRYATSHTRPSREVNHNSAAYNDPRPRHVCQTTALASWVRPLSSHSNEGLGVTEHRVIDLSASHPTTRRGQNSDDSGYETAPPIADSVGGTQSIATAGAHPRPHRWLPDIGESQVYDSLQSLVYKIQPLGNPSLVPFVKNEDNENLGVKKTTDSHIPMYMCSNIIDAHSVAFWYPGPNLVPPGGGHRGVQIGDLGYFDDSGEFRTIFNIFRSYNQNINDGAKPPCQPYQHYPAIDLWLMVKHLDIQRHNTYTSSNIEKLGQEASTHTQSLYRFGTSRRVGRCGAIIVLPNGGHYSYIEDAFFQVPEVKRHFRDYAPSWYQHARQYIPNKTNGALHLIRGTHCARTWAIAVFASKRDIKEPLYATLSSNPLSEHEHMWQTSDSRWKTSTGPSSDELNESQGGELPLNQCIGVIISSLRLDEVTWRANFDPLSSRNSSPDRGSGGWGLRRFNSQSSSSSIHTQDNSGRTKRGLMATIFHANPTEMRAFGDDGTLSSHGSSAPSSDVDFSQDYMLLHQQLE